MKIIFTLFVTLMLSYLIALVSSMVDVDYNHGKITSHLYKKEPNFKLPNGYKLMYSKNLDKYIIEHHDYCYSGEYLHVSAIGFKSQLLFADIDQPTYFSDSSLAKGALKEYLGIDNDFK